MLRLLKFLLPDILNHLSDSLLAHPDFVPVAVDVVCLDAVKRVDDRVQGFDIVIHVVAPFGYLIINLYIIAIISCSGR